MVGMEEIEIHSKSYLVRWINVSGEHTISWSIQPHKKSLNFGIFKHPGTSGPTTGSSIHSTSEYSESNKENASFGNIPPLVTEKLKTIGLRPIAWIGKCEADKISQGTYDVQPEEGGNYALVFDNTFSKQISKTATFVLLTYPTNCPPRPGHQVHHSQALATSVGNSVGSRSAPNIKHSPSESTESLRFSRGRAGRSSSNVNSKGPPGSAGSFQSLAAPVHTGVLYKRRRKRHQGHARRFFSLDFNLCTLSYYHDRNSSALRGSIPLSLAAIATNDENREISIDSGAEIWHLRALNNEDFVVWKKALEKASKATKELNSGPKLKVRTQLNQSPSMDKTHSQAWGQVEKLVAKVASAREVVRNLAKETDPKYLDSPVEPRNLSRDRSPSQAPASSLDDSVETSEKRSIWKTRSGKDGGGSIRSHRNISPQSPMFPFPPAKSPLTPQVALGGPSGGQKGIHDDLMNLLHDLTSVVSEFSGLLLQQKQMRPPAPPQVHQRLSMDSDGSEEFFDAVDVNASPLLTIQRDSDDEDSKTEQPSPVIEDDEASSISDAEDSCDYRDADLHLKSTSPLFPTKAKSLTPLPVAPVSRRTQIAPPRVPPPSLISFLRKNVGKDLSTISMPVSANEPLSLLQRAAEQLEYSQLLDLAASATDALERLIYVTAFAVSSLSSSRIKDRAIRKPFNPMLGETFELVREDKGFRFIAEKVSHRPVQLALQADSKDWSLAQSPKPTQKFWGKSAEVITEGKVRVSLHSNGEQFSWSPATSFLRNIIAGEKYVEPVGEMVIVNETTGQKTIATFKAGGMFAGRSEDVTVKAFGTHGEELPLGLQGTWTNSLQLTENDSLTNTTIWKAGSLVDKPAKHYGFTSFVVALNEITAVEKGKLPSTDSRLRPDQRALEDGDLDRAEALKAQLEERQRERRRDMEGAGESWQPRWFSPIDCDHSGDQEAVWRLRSGKDSYWEERSRGEWTGVVPVFEL